MSNTLRLNLYHQSLSQPIDPVNFDLPLSFKNDRLLPIPKMSKKHLDTLNQIHIDLLRTQIPFKPEEKLPDKWILDCMQILY